jgi:type II secretion system protein L
MTDIRLAFLRRDGALSPEIRVTTPGSRPRQTRILAAPGEAILGRWIDAPGQTPAQMRAAALSLLAPDLAAPPDACAIGLGDRQGDLRLVCVAARTDVDRWRAQAAAAGFDADLVIPDFALLSGAGETVQTARQDGFILAAGPGLAFAAEPDLARALLASGTSEEVDLETAAIAWARRGGATRAPDLLAGLPTASTQTDTRRRLSRTLLVAAVALLLGVLAPWIQVWRLHSTARDMRAASQAVVQTLVPQAPSGASSRALLLEELSLLRADPRLLALTAEALGALAEAPSADLQELTVRAPGELRAVVLVASPDELAPVRDQVQRSGIVLEEASAPAGDGRLSVEMILRGAP